ncbi:gibberellin 2-beta-dioxygenase 2-like [Gastrolobium bilobum]|uniref:gibberellin 2-beta-dioxygenase 2-like n=1 Tax=Gastrolobium bilobum TaxID=150636 RepID=UPI002AAF28E3|nr:gibberellin 2-beta-dioxygenase 2-like [Gastrolobium bilobum]
MVVASTNSIRSEKIIPIELPVVDLTAERSMLIKLIVKSSEEYGFFNVINHGVSHDIIAKMEEAGFDFFAKPLAQKKQAAPGNPFGYGCKNIGFNGDIGEVEYLLLNANAPSIAQPSKNIYNDPSNFSSTVSAYTDGVRELACEILELMAEGLGVPDTLVFSRLIREVDSDSVLRLNHYPPILNKDSNHWDKSPSYNSCKVGFGEHSDPQIITILRSNDVGGLQISLEDGVWNPVTPDPSAFSVNVGDLLEVMTNGRFVSVRHRAVTNACKSRMSVAYFGAPPLHACIVAPPVMVTPQRPSLFKPFTWAEYKKATYSLRLGECRIDLFRKCTQVE